MRALPLLLSLAGVAALTLVGGLARRQPQPEVIDAGRLVYTESCDSCHGTAATGRGPAASVLSTQPADLTRLAYDLGQFPRESIRWSVTGRIRRVPAHGVLDMPVWRTSLNDPVWPGGPAKIDALLDFLESIQQTPFGEPGSRAARYAAAGVGAYRTHCAGCHGPDGRGGAIQALPGVAAPDLTTIARRNPETFSIEALVETIARHDDDSGIMPSWSKVLRRQGWNNAMAASLIESVASYVASIQQE